MADSSQPLPKPPSSTESDGDPDLSVYTTPKEQREQGRDKKRGRVSEVESPNPTEKQKLKFEEDSPQKEHSDSIQKVQRAAIVTKSPFLDTNMGNSTDVPVEKPNGIKPYRDYLDPNHKLTYEQEKDIQCASVHYTFEQIAKIPTS